jgi:DUF1680 family protein
MKNHAISIGLVLTGTMLLLGCGSKESAPATDYPITPVDFTQVQLQDGFWKTWVERAVRNTIPFAFKKCEETGRVDNFIFAAGIREGKFRGRYGFDDSDVYKIMEGASYSLMLDHDPVMESYLDTLVSYISGAQEEDGYLYTAWTLKANDYNDFACCTYSPEGQWVGTPESSHEFYDAGHMYEAAVAHFLATGKRSFLDVALRNADLIYDVCMVQGHDYISGHQEIEIGLAKLYRVTGDTKYIELAKHLLDLRGQTDRGEYSQAHLPVTEQDQAVGHAVRANYMYSAMADVAALTGDSAYLEAIGKIWANVVGKKLSITGGVGASPRGEAYGGDYDLPNHPYNETCAAIANVYWNHRMFLLHGDAKYMDVVERTLYNGLISGLSLDGVLFFYPNTLEHDGVTPFNQGVNGRSPWFDCSCCPSNLSRFVPSVAGYAYAVKDQDLYVNLYMNSSVEVETGRGTLGIRQYSNYPWEGKIDLEVTNEKESEGRILLRVPGWALNRPVPSDLFRYEGGVASQPVLLVNGKEREIQLENGYIPLEGKWKKGDVITLMLPMEVRRVRANEQVNQKLGRLAIEYGPIVYCGEEIDNPSDVLETAITGETEFQARFRPELMGGVNMLESRELQLVPYYSWANRGAGKMNVWFLAE